MQHLFMSRFQTYMSGSEDKSGVMDQPAFSLPIQTEMSQTSADTESLYQFSIFLNLTSVPHYVEFIGIHFLYGSMRPENAVALKTVEVTHHD